MKYRFSWLALLIFCSCSQSAISKKLSGSDSLLINFNHSNSDSVIRTVSTTEKTAIRKFIHFLDGKETEKYKCGYDGNLIFFKEGEAVLPVAFKYDEEGCRHFLFEDDGKLMSTRINGEAADMLQSLEEGKSWY